MGPTTNGGDISIELNIGTFLKSVDMGSRSKTGNLELADQSSLGEPRPPAGYSNSHSSGTIVGCVVGDSKYENSTSASPPPGLLGVILNAKWNKWVLMETAYRITTVL